MVFKAFVTITLVLLIPLITGVAVNTRVYRYFYLTPVEVEYGLFAERICVGFVILTNRDNAIQIQPGRTVCTTGKGESVHESIFIRIRASLGTSVYSRLLKLHINTTKPLTLYMIVEYPAIALNATIVLYRGGNLVGALQLSDPKSRLALYVEPGVTEYTVNLRVTCYKQGIYNFRVGVYIANG